MDYEDTNPGITVSATDADAGDNALLTFSTTDLHFQVDAMSGEVQVKMQMSEFELENRTLC